MRSGTTESKRWTHWVDGVAGLIFVAMLAARLAAIPSPVSGIDGGNWLALAAKLAGTETKAASTVYPPLFLAWTLAVQTLLPPIEALRVSGAVASALPGLATFWLLRAYGLRAYALLGLTLSFSGYSSEMLAWGGYPQLLGSALLIGAVAALVHATQSGRVLHLALAGLLGGGAVATNQLTGFQAVMAVGVTWGIWAVTARPGWTRFLGRSVVLGACAALATTPGIPAYFGLLRGTSTAAFDSQGFGDWSAKLFYLVNEGPMLWAVVFAAVIPALGVLAWRRDGARLGAVAGLLAASVGLALVTGEVRALYLAQAVGLLSYAIVLHAARTARVHWRPLQLSVTLVACALVLSLAGAGMQRFQRSLLYYAVLDQNVVDGLQWLADHSREGDRAASAAAWRNWPFGWWVEGIGRVPTYTETDPRWVVFADEKEHVRIAMSIFSQADPRRAAASAQQHGVTLLVIDTRDNGRAAQWRKSGKLAEPIAMVYTNPSLTIFRVDPPDSDLAASTDAGE